MLYFPNVTRADDQASTGSRAATAFLIIWIACIYIRKTIKKLIYIYIFILTHHIVCLSAQWVTSGRIAWAFARDVSFFLAEL